MGDWRHFGPSLELTTVPDCGTAPSYIDLMPRPALDERASFNELSGNLSRLVEGEILPRLMLAHRTSQISQHKSAAPLPLQDEVENFCVLLLDPVANDLKAHVLTLLEKGRGLEAVLLQLLVPTARRLGELWEQDECDFVQVTVGIGRLQAVTRELCSHLERQTLADGQRRVLLIPCPGETHTFTLSIVGSFFREDGWDVTTASGSPDVEMADLVRHEWFDVIGLTLSCDVLLPALTIAVRDIRKASCNRGIRVLVGGPCFDRQPDRVEAVGADAMAGDGRMAPLIAESLLERRARAR